MTKHLFFLIVILSLGGCASSQLSEQRTLEASKSLPENRVETPKKHAENSDVLEPINRAIWVFNWDFLDKYFLRPVTVGYTTVVPKPIRTGLYNAILNLEEPANIVNNALQGKGKEAGTSAGRFLINTTVGLLGTIDVAGKHGLKREKEEFGEVLGVYGVGTGPYLMVPALGPSDTRSLTGDFVDNLYVPIQNGGFALGAARTLISAIEKRAALIQQEKLINDSLDPYVFVKDAYFQNLEFKVKDGNVEQEIDEEFEEDLDDFLESYDGI